MWHRIAPDLAESHTVVASDLRGYGDSGKPTSGTEPADDHETYSKRVMAQDQVALMASLGYDSFRVVGHDRGARVSHRMALDHPERIEKLAVLDIAPTLAMYQATDQDFATAYYHWFFFIQPYDFPERMIGADPDGFLDHTLRSWSRVEGAFDPRAVAEYKRHFREPATIHATCEDYRASAGIDLRHDEADLARKIDCPLLVLWGGRGLVGRKFDVLALWRERASDVRGAPLDCGHFLPEERPDETLAALRSFLG